MLTNVLLIIIIFLECYKIFFKDLLNKYKDNKYDKEVVDEEPKLETVIYQQQMYNVEGFKERMKKLKEAQETDEDGLFDTNISLTLEDLGYFTGVE